MKQEMSDIIDLMYEMDSNPIDDALDSEEAALRFKAAYPLTEYSTTAIKRAWHVGLKDLEKFIQEEFGEEIERLMAKCN